MDLLKRVESIVSYTKSLENQLYDKHKCVYEMKEDFTFPSLNYERLTPHNVSVGDIIHCTSGGKTLFCRVTKINPTVINVDDLNMKLINFRIKFFLKDEKNILHKGTLGYTRKIFILNKDEWVYII